LNPTNCFLRKYSLIGQVTVAFHCKCCFFDLTPDLGEQMAGCPPNGYQVWLV
jgi:hypothetical protein